MDRWTNGWMEGGMDGRMKEGRCMNGWVNGQTDVI